MSKSKDYAVAVPAKKVEVAAKALRSNGFKVEVLNTLEDASERVKEIIPEGSEVFTATSVTLNESGLTEHLNESEKYISVRNKFMKLVDDPNQKVEMRRIGSGAEYSIGSVHAVTEDGQVVIASASGSQIPGYVYGATNVIWLVGAQKIVKDLDEAFERIEKHTLPLEDIRAQKAYGANSSLNKLLVYRKEPAGRVTILLLNEAIGY
jgi:hypothetical protein